MSGGDTLAETLPCQYLPHTGGFPGLAIVQPQTSDLPSIQALFSPFPTHHRYTRHKLRDFVDVNVYIRLLRQRLVSNPHVVARCAPVPFSEDP